MSKRESLALIDKAYYALERALESKADRDWRTYYQQNLDEEKGHRRFKFTSVSDGITAPQAARLFCVRQVAEYVNGDKAPDVSEIFSLRLSLYMACALVARYREQITAALTPFDLQSVLALDYAELNKSKEAA